MFDVAIVTRALEGSGHDVAESTVDEITRLSQAAEHKAAAERAAMAIEAGATDVRLVVAFLLGVFDERGPAALPAVFGVLATALGPRFFALRPSARRERAVDSALSLLFRSVSTSIDFHENVRDAVWRRWSERVEHDLASACVSAAVLLEAAIADRITSPRSVMELSGLRARTELCLKKLPPPSPPKERDALEAPPPIVEAQPSSAAVETQPPARAAEPEETKAPAPSASLAEESRRIEVSTALDGFMRKLDAFAALVARGEMGKAAIVAHDIKGCVEHFDPRVYLPKLLSPYFRLLSLHIEAIAPHWEATETPGWQALEQLYQVDLEAFLEP